METNIVYEATPKTSIDEFVADLEYEFTDAPHDLLVHNVQRVVAQMCEQSNILRRVAYIHTQECVPNYIIEAPDCMQLIALMSICYCHSRYMHSPLIRLTGSPCDVCCCRDNNVHIEGNELVFSSPKDCDVFRIEMSVKPTYQTCELDTNLLTDYYETICLGVRSLMYDMLDKPWSSVQRAALTKQEFYRACSDDAVRTMLHHQRGALRVRRLRAF